MDVLSDGVRVVWEYRWGTILLYLTVAGLGGWLEPAVRVDKASAIWVRFPIRMMAGLAILVCGSLCFAFLGLVWSPSLVAGAVLLPIFAAGGWVRAGFRREEVLPALALGFALGIVLVFRMAFLSELILPPYRDSAQHTQIVQGLLHPGVAGDSRYWGAGGPLKVYHFGFHGLAAWLAKITGSDDPLLLAFLGQALLVFYPFAVLALAGRLIGDLRGAVFAGLLAGFGWAMPAFAANWAKYPAMGALTLLPAILACGLAAHASRSRAWWSILALISVGGVLLHTRLAVVFALLLPAGAAALAWPAGRRRWLDCCLFAGLVTAAAWTNRLVLLAGYANWPLLALLAAFLPWAFGRHPRAALGLAVFLLGIGLAVGAHTPSFLRAESPYWLDRPFAQMLLSLPLALLGGLGLDGCLQYLAGRRLAQAALLVAGMLALGWSAWPRSHYFPDVCCAYVKEEDADALGWIDRNLPPGATMMIAGFRERKYLFETDAGMWVGVLTDIQVQKLDFKFDFASPQTWERICPYGEVYIYVGSMPFSFDRRVISNDRGFETVYQNGAVSIVYAAGCSEVK